MKKITAIFILIFAIMTISTPVFVFALGRGTPNYVTTETKNDESKNELKDSGSNSPYTYTLLQSLPGKDGGELKGDVSLDDYLSWMYKFGLTLAGFLSVMMITIGGVQYIASGASEKLKSEATDRITNALYGLVLAFGAYIVLYTINPDLVTFENNKFINPDKNKETTTKDNGGQFEGGDGGEFKGSGTTGSWK